MKQITNILIAFCCCSFVFAQNKPETQNPKQNTEIDTTTKFRNTLFKSGSVLWGIKAGFSSSNIYGSDIDYVFANNETNFQPAFHLGIWVDTKIEKHLYLKHELLFNQKGAGVTLTDSINGNYSAQFKTYYLDFFPISPTLYFKGVQIYTGPYISALIDAQINRKNETGKTFIDHSIFGNPSQFEDKSKYLQKMDFGIEAGLAYQLPYSLSIGAKYTHGFFDIFQSANGYIISGNKHEIKIYNRAFWLSVSYLFNGKRKIE